MATTTKRTERLYTFYYREPLYPHHPVNYDLKFTAYPHKCGAWKRLKQMFNKGEVHSIGISLSNTLY